MTAIREACEANELQYKGFWSAAGHDAKYMATICPTGMVFVRSQGGLSHAEGEYSTAEDCAVGAQVLLDATLKLANTLS